MKAYKLIRAALVEADKEAQSLPNSDDYGLGESNGYIAGLKHAYELVTPQWVRNVREALPPEYAELLIDKTLEGGAALDDSASAASVCLKGVVWGGHYSDFFPALYDYLCNRASKYFPLPPLPKE